MGSYPKFFTYGVMFLLGMVNRFSGAFFGAICDAGENGLAG